MPKNKTTKEDISAVADDDFATQLAELEKVVTDLESDITIEKALALFERGMHLSNKCEKFLSAAEQKVEILKRSANGMSIEIFSETSMISASITKEEDEDS